MIDTGSPDVLLSPGTFPAVTPSSIEAVNTLTFGNVTFEQPTIIGADTINSPDSTVSIAGVIGCSILCNLEVSLDYRDAMLTLGGVSLPADVETSGPSVAFTLLGGGAAFPPSRILVDTAIEGGTSYVLLLDTGASFVNLSTSVFDTIAADGRAQLPLQDLTVQGMSTATATRLKSLGFAGVQAEGVVAAKSSVIDSAIAQIAQEGACGGWPPRGELPSQLLCDHRLSEWPHIFQISSHGSSDFRLFRQSGHRHIG